jgi:hypothetical protein
VRAVPESFDGMLAELAEAAAAGVTLPDLADVRRRARQRTVHRRVTASALAFALVCVSGVAGVAIDARFRPPGKISAVSAPSGSSAPLGTGPASGTAAPTPHPSASAETGDSYYAAYTGVWVGKASPNYVMVFPDGAVGLSQAESFPLCYGQAQGTTGASPTATSSAGTGKLYGATAAGAASISTASTTTVSTLPFTAAACDDSGTIDGLALQTTGSDKVLTILNAEDARAEGMAYATAYLHTLSLGATIAGTDAVKLKELVGQWVAVDGSKRVLKIDGDGSVTYATPGLSTAAGSGSGEIDAYYASGTRVLTDCSAAQEDMMMKGGEAFTFDVGQVCGVLLIESGKTADEITVYTGSGPVAFVHGG